MIKEYFNFKSIIRGHKRQIFSRSKVPKELPTSGESSKMVSEVQTWIAKKI